ncbi:hypothetical protein Taro_007081 [Colocasia esculenta]|uniref:Uncharacterized protein n=1 Tax=Colocasia esculenta TaxID=4460 RepID=A0A843TZG4_COLES|nr:hypothetical protein [Colocasia esculenta]
MVLRSGRMFNRVFHQQDQVPPTWEEEEVQDGPVPGTQYDLLKHLDRTLARITILELIKRSPTHQEALMQYLQKTIVQGIKGTDPIPAEVQGTDPIPAEVQGTDPIPAEVLGTDPFLSELLGTDPFLSELFGAAPTPAPVSGPEPTPVFTPSPMLASVTPGIKPGDCRDVVSIASVSGSAWDCDRGSRRYGRRDQGRDGGCVAFGSPVATWGVSPVSGRFPERELPEPPSGLKATKAMSLPDWIVACESLAELSWLVWDAEDSLEFYPAQASQSFFSLPRSLRPRNRESSQQRQGACRAEETGR